MSRWFRLYDDLVEDPKVQRLTADAFRGLINLWCLASKGGGALPPIDDIAFKLRLTPAKARSLVAGLKEAGLLEDSGNGLRPHNWDQRQHKSDTSNERVKRHRERQRNVTKVVTVTPPDTDTESEQNSEADASGADAPDDPSPAERDLFERGRAVLGRGATGLIRNLLRAKGGNVALARATLEEASQRHEPTEFIGGAIRRAHSPTPEGSSAHAGSVVAAGHRLVERMSSPDPLRSDQGGNGGNPPLRLLAEGGRG